VCTTFVATHYGAYKNHTELSRGHAFCKNGATFQCIYDENMGYFKSNICLAVLAIDWVR